MKNKSYYALYKGNRKAIKVSKKEANRIARNETNAVLVNKPRSAKRASKPKSNWFGKGFKF